MIHLICGAPHKETFLLFFAAECLFFHFFCFVYTYSKVGKHKIPYNLLMILSMDNLIHCLAGAVYFSSFFMC
jgi:hypothetical protein